MPYWSWITVPLIFRYHLPLRFPKSNTLLLSPDAAPCLDLLRSGGCSAGPNAAPPAGPAAPCCRPPRCSQRWGSRGWPAGSWASPRRPPSRRGRAGSTPPQSPRWNRRRAARPSPASGRNGRRRGRRLLAPPANKCWGRDSLRIRQKGQALARTRLSGRKATSARTHLAKDNVDRKKLSDVFWFVMLTKKEGGQEGDRKSAFVWHCGDQGLFYIWTCLFSINNLFPFLLATALLMGDVIMNRWRGVKMFLSVITALLVLAKQIDFLIGWCHVNTPMFEYLPCKFDPPRLFKI